VHHTNEIAQTEAITGKKWVQWWLHGEFLLMDEGKMSKSADNFLTVSKLAERGYDPLAYRLYLMSAHYRKAMSFNFETLDGSQKALERLRGRAEQLPASTSATPDIAYQERFNKALEDDLNMPIALSQMWMMLQDDNLSDEVKTATLLDMDVVLQLKPFEKSSGSEEITDEAILALIDERTEARVQKNYARSDEIRDELLAMGIQLKDSPKGVTFERTKPS
jgi:cysteinyl-tRNA synthetase